MMENHRWLVLLRTLLPFLAISIANIAAGQGQKPEGATPANGTGDTFASEIAGELSQLNRAKLDALLGHIGKASPAGFYDCLCSGKWHAGHVGVGYDGAKGECRFSGLGTWHEPLPDRPGPWVGCADAKRYPDGRSLGEAISATLRPPMPDIDPGKLSDSTLGLTPPSGFASASRLREAMNGFQRACLPVADNLGELLDDTSRIANRNEIYEQALRIIDEAKPDTCEGAYAAKLFLQSQSGLYAGEIAVSALQEFVIPDDVDRTEGGAKGIELILRRAGRVSGMIGTLGALKDTFEVSKLFKEQYQNAQGNAQAAAAFQAFQSTRGASAEKIAAEVSGINAALLAKTRQIEADEVEKAARILRLQPTVPRPASPERAPGDAAKWADFDSAQRGIVSEFDDRKAAILFEMAGLQMKLKAVRDLRGPLAAKGCASVMAELAKGCNGGTAK